MISSVHALLYLAHLLGLNLIDVGRDSHATDATMQKMLFKSEKLKSSDFHHFDLLPRSVRMKCLDSNGTQHMRHHAHKAVQNSVRVSINYFIRWISSRKEA